MVRLILIIVIFCSISNNSFGRNDSIKERKINYGLLFEFLGSGGVGSINFILDQKISKKTNLFYRLGGIYYRSNPTLSGERIPITSVPLNVGIQYGKKLRISLYLGLCYWSGYYEDERRTTNQRTLETEPGKRSYLTSVFFSSGVEISFQLSKQVSIGCGLAYLKYLFEINERSLGKYSYYSKLKENEFKERMSIQEFRPLINLKIKFKK